jgi:hypothetical protein
MSDVNSNIPAPGSISLPQDYTPAQLAPQPSSGPAAIPAPVQPSQLQASQPQNFNGQDFDSIGTNPSDGQATKNPAQASQPQNFNGQDFDSLPDQTPPNENETNDSDTNPGFLEEAKNLETGLESGITFGASNWLRPERSKQAQTENPGLFQVGQVAGSLVPAAMTSFIPGANVAEASGAMAKIGSGVLSGLIQGGMWGFTDENAKLAAGLGDPNESVAHALLGAGAHGALFGGIIGGGLGTLGAGASKSLDWLGETKAGMSMSQGLQDFANRWKFRSDNPDMVAAVADELKNFHEALTEGSNEVYGKSGLKAGAIQKLTANIAPEAVVPHVINVQKILDSTPEELQKTKEFQSIVNQWKQTVSPPVDINQQLLGVKQALPQANDVFQATDTMKKQLGELAYPKGLGEGQYVPMSDRAYINGARAITGQIADTLEDTKVWGDAGDLQKGVNKAFSEFKPARKDFLAKFTSPELGDRVIDPGKVNTYVNQLGKATAEQKQNYLGNYLDAGQRYQKKISDLYLAQGLESPFVDTSVNTLRETLNKTPTNGAKFADTLWNIGKNHISRSLGGGALTGSWGAVEGTRHGGPIEGLKEGAEDFLIGSGISAFAPKTERLFTHVAVPLVLHVLGAGEPFALEGAAAHAGHIQKGAQILKSGINSLFDTGKSLSIDAAASAANSKKVRHYVENGKLDDDLNEAAQQAGIPKQYAKGGIVATNPGTFKSKNSVANFLPEQNTMMATARSRVYSHLRSMMPSAAPGMPLDPSTKPLPHHERNYTRSIDLAATPAKIFASLKNGSITQNEIVHFATMYPEIHQLLSKKIMEKIIDHKEKGKDLPPYKVRQAMSMFMGQPLESIQTPQSIQAAQSIYQQTPPPAAAKTNKLQQMSTDYRTSSQATQARQQSSKV